MGCNTSVPLKVLFLLKRSVVPSCEPASQEYTIDRIFHQMLMTENPDLMMTLLDMADRLVETVPCYCLRCDMTDISVEEAYRTPSVFLLVFMQMDHNRREGPADNRHHPPFFLTQQQFGIAAL